MYYIQIIVVRKTGIVTERNNDLTVVLKSWHDFVDFFLWHFQCCIHSQEKLI